MKNLIKMMLVVAVIFATSNANAQGDLNFGVNAGVTTSNMFFSYDDDDDDFEDYGATIGYTVGVTVEYGITDVLYLQSGLSLLTKGAESEVIYNEEGINYTVDTKLKPMYLQMPINIAYKFQIGETTKINLNGGPYLAYGIGGKVTAKAGGHKEEIDFFGGEDDEDSLGAKSFDFGLGFGAGVEFGKISVNLGYHYGLMSFSRYDGETAINGSAALTVGYKF